MLKAIQTCSYNDSGEGLEATVLANVNRERAAGNEFVNHLMLRNSSDAKNQMKFNLLLAGIPLFLYNLFSMYKARIEEVVTIGHEDTGAIHRKFIDAFGAKGYTFVNEGGTGEWSLSSTLKKAIVTVPTDKPALVVPGDTPFVNLSQLAENGDTYDVVLPFNTREIGGEHFPRNYHVILLDGRGARFFAKEPNAYILNINKIASNRFGFDFFDMIFGSRKSYTGGNPQMRLFKEMFFRNNGKFSLKRTMRSIHYFEPLHFSYEYLRIHARDAMHKNESDNNLVRIKVQTISNLIRHSLDLPGLKVKIYPTPDPAGLIDLDSLEDVAFAEHLLSLDPEQVYPHFYELKEFARSVKTWTGGFTDNWRRFANAQYAHFGIPALYTPEGKMQQSVFPEERIMGELQLLRNYRQSSHF